MKMKHMMVWNKGTAENKIFQEQKSGNRRRKQL